jgi:hypothetical protein
MADRLRNASGMMDGGNVVASYGIGRFKGERSTILAASVCDGTGLRFEGESFH